MGTSLVGSCRPHASPPSLAGPYPGQGAWGWAQSPAIQLLLSQSEFNKSVCPPFVGVDILTAKGASFMVWACVCLGDTSFPVPFDPCSGGTNVERVATAQALTRVRGNICI